MKGTLSRLPACWYSSSTMWFFTYLFGYTNWKSPSSKQPKGVIKLPHGSWVESSSFMANLATSLRMEYAPRSYFASNATGKWSNQPEELNRITRVPSWPLFDDWIRLVGEINPTRWNLLPSQVISPTTTTWKSPLKCLERNDVIESCVFW